jgi:hypothetical protein
MGQRSERKPLCSEKMAKSHRQCTRPKEFHQSCIGGKNKIFLLPLHIKLGLTKNFVKAMSKEGQSVAYLQQKFPQVSKAKIKEGIFIGPQIRLLLGDPIFTKKLNKFENRAWRAFENVRKNFLGNIRSTNYIEIVE